MATITNYDEIYLLPDIPDFEVSGLSSGATCKVKIATESDTIFEEDLSADSSGNIKISDLPDLFDGYFEDVMFKLFSITVTLRDGTTLSSSIMVVYGNVECGSFEDFIDRYYLSPYTSKRTSLGRKEVLTLYSETALNAEAHIKVRAYYDDGTWIDKTITSDDMSHEESNDIYDYEDVEGESTKVTKAYCYTINVSPSKFLDESMTLKRYVVMSYVSGSGDTTVWRTLEYVMDPYHEDCDTAFLYKNCFGAWDMLYCNGRTETDDTFEREGTYINGAYKNYKVTEVKNFNCDTGVLMPNELAMAEDLLRSKEVYKCKFSNGTYSQWKEVAITDSDATHTDEPDDMPRFTFTCRLAQKRQNILDYHKFPEIFTEQYTSTYE